MGQARARRVALGDDYGKPTVEAAASVASAWLPHIKPIAQSGQHHYILVHENGRIETLVCKRCPPGRHGRREPVDERGTVSEHIDKHDLNGYHMLSEDLMVFWRDSGSMDGSKINRPVSNYFGFTCYGPVLFCRQTQYSDGLKQEQYDSIIAGLKTPAAAV